jgi:ElaB/YqjD/DUF883 family membrane-anchored ribosome-binding protein
MAIRRNLQALKEDLDVLAVEAAHLAASPPDDANPALHELRQSLNRVRADFQHVIYQRGSPSSAFAVADKIVEPVENSLSARPVATLAVGFGLGLLLGLMWRRE